MALTRNQIVNTATELLRDQGLAGLSMRRVAQQLGVQAGALYHHVASKQDLLAAVGEQILSDSAATISINDPEQAAADLRTTLLQIRDGAEVISFVHAYKPESLGPLHSMQMALAQRLPAGQAPLVTEALIRYVLGFVAVEQNRSELLRARILQPEPSAVDADAAFGFGVRALLAGVSSHQLDSSWTD